MAKKKGNRFIIGLECTETGLRSYISTKNKINNPEKIEVMKYNKKLMKHTLHKEIQRLK